ncbi:MAG: hypothetical protein NWF10_00340 [Candidatus Bathyarchaeota archaeon]|nr:hypothetical protein [Candidatus Bathyarchaeota archaeon]
MNSTVYTSALQNTLSEIKNICPEVSNSFVFNDSDLIAKDDSTSKKNIDQAIVAFNLVEKEAKTIGGLKSIRVEGTKGKLNLAYMDKFNLATVISNKADENYVNTITKVLVPTVIKLVDEIKVISPEIEAEINENPKPIAEPPEKDLEIKQETSQELSEIKNPPVTLIEPPANEKVEVVGGLNYNPNTEDNSENQSIEEKSPIEFEDNNFLAEPPVTQLIVEKLGGILVPSDTVRIDKEIIEKWTELFDGKKIKMVHIENVNGKSTQSKFRNIKSSKHAGKGVIRIPDKIQLELETSKGELVTIKPVID